MKTLLIVSALAASAMVSLPQQAEAGGYRGDRHYDYHRYHSNHQRCEWRRHWHRGGWRWYRHCW